MFDSTDRDWEGAGIELHLGDKNESFSFDRLDPSLNLQLRFSTCEEERLDVNFISGNGIPKYGLSFEIRMALRFTTVVLVPLRD